MSYPGRRKKSEVPSGRGWTLAQGCFVPTLHVSWIFTISAVSKSGVSAWEMPAGGVRKQNTLSLGSFQSSVEFTVHTFVPVTFTCIGSSSIWSKCARLRISLTVSQRKIPRISNGSSQLTFSILLKSFYVNFLLLFIKIINSQFRLLKERDWDIPNP